MTQPEQSDIYLQRQVRLLEAMPDAPLTIGVKGLRERLPDFSSHEIRAKLVDLRRRNLVTYEPGYRRWTKESPF